MPLAFSFAVRASAIACTALFLAAPAAAQCWSGGAAGQGVPRESLLVTNRAPFAVNVMAGPAGGARRVLGQVPAGTTMSFASVLPPGRNETTVWVDSADQDKYKLASSRRHGIIVIANRREATCRRAARLEITPQVFDAGTRRTTDVARRMDLSRLAPGAGPRRPAAAPPRTTAPARQPGPPNGGAGIVSY
ncbi:MAG TPA: hypothetical protein VIF14_16175 [Alphaproteobacteria bacterium]|jgi:hypothetical protein